jgi:hypothetical protein
MRRILPAISTAGILLAGCATAAARPAPSPVMPAADPELYRCAERAALELGFTNQRSAIPGGAEFTATTAPNQVTGIYDGLRVRILSDSGRVITWVTASPYSALVQSRTPETQLLPSRRAIDAATVVERRCTKALGDVSLARARSPHPRDAGAR